MYIAANTATVIVNTTSMTEIEVLNHDPIPDGRGSYAPYGTEYMVSSNTWSDPLDAVRYLKTTTRQFDTALPNFNAVNAQDVIVYNGSLPIVVHSVEEQSLTISSPNYEVTLLGSNYLYVDSYVQDSQLVIHAIILHTQTTHVTLIIDAVSIICVQ